MKEEIERYLTGMHFDSRNGKLSRKNMQIVADHFGGTLISGRYLKIGGTEYKIRRNNNTSAWEAIEMTWTHGNDWRFYSPY